jgi:sugar lactone lactonase YvrE
MQSILQRVLYVFILVFLTTTVFAQAPVISPLAGTGNAGYSGDGGPATSADLDSPSQVAADPKGNVYIADRNNNRIRRVSAGGVINTIAGNGTTGYWYLEGGPAISSVLNHPFGNAVDIVGNLYIADFGGWSTVGFTNLYVVSGDNNGPSRIHRVDPATGTINQIQLPITLNGTLALAVDGVANLYIAERFGQHIYKYNVVSKAFANIAGTGTAGFSGDGGPAINAQIHNPGYLAVDAAGNVYFSDILNNRIRKIAAGTGIITTVAGSGTAGFSGDGGPATAAQLNNPEGVTLDPQGNIFIADTGNKRIRRVSANTGVITTVISAQTSGDCQAVLPGLDSPGSLTMNAAGDTLFITDDAANRVWQALLNPVKVVPVLTSIAPPSGVPGATVSVTLTGSGFAAGVPAASGCQNASVATISVSGTGVTASNISVTSDTSMTANLAIAGNAALGTRNITVSTDGGVSGAIPFNVVAPTLPTPTLTSVTPGSAVQGTSATVTLLGTNFDTKAGNTSVSIDGSGITATQVTVASATSLTAVFNIAAEAALGTHNVRVATNGGTSNAVSLNVLPAGPAFTYGIPPMLNPTDQTPIQVALAGASPNPVTATLTLTFAPNAMSSSDDPNVTFVNAQTNTRSATVTFPPNTTTAQLSLPDGVLQAGTEAGTIQLAMTGVQVGGVAATPSGGNFDVQIPRLPPVITNIRIFNRSSSGFDVEITGYSTSREITAATFDFGAASGAKLLTVELQPSVSPAFTSYYQSDASSTVGGAFVYTQPFNAQQGDANVVTSVTVTLANSAGTSQPKTAP